MPKTIVFLCNSPIDGFRGGDGDLFDKLTLVLNDMDPSISAQRIIADPPPEDIHRPPEQLIVIDELPDVEDLSLAHLHFSQQRLVNYILNTPAENKILYIGSRIDNYRKDPRKVMSISVGSGALLTEDVIIALKMHGVKIVICCLELVFHTRSLVTSFRLYEMLKNHLQYADSIHCLTEQDRYYLQNGLITQLLNAQRLIDPAFPIKSVEGSLKLGKISSGKAKSKVLGDFPTFYSKYFENNPENYRHYFTDFPAEEIAKRLTTVPSVYASGICTISGLTENEASLETLMKRGKNILIFGLIRPHKGIEEGLALAKLLKQQKSDAKVYIVGKILNITCTIREIFNTTFDSESIAKSKIPFKKRFSDCIKSENPNQSIQALYDDLIRENVTKKNNIELALDVADEQLLPYIMSCRYALKLDVKGFAENASSMISTIVGMCLPTIAQRGLVTPTSVDDFSHALCLIDGKPVLYNSEVCPAKIDVKNILNIIQESDEVYLQRIQSIIALRKSKRFDVRNTASILMQEVFLPLIQTAKQSEKTKVAPLLPVQTRYGIFSKSVSSNDEPLNSFNHQQCEGTNPQYSGII